MRNEFDKLRAEMRQEIRGLEERMVTKLKDRIDLLIKVFIGFDVPLLVAVIGMLMRPVFMY